MAGPCEILIAGGTEDDARILGARAAGEATRIEGHLSRYRDDNVIHAINTARGAPVTVDAETAALLTYADTCWQLSDGAFDVTSGVLRRAWTFDGSDRIPSPERVTPLVDLVGWDRVHWDPPEITLPAGMEIDLGGIGKEYAVDRTAALLAEAGAPPSLVNFGGDVAITAPRTDGTPWQVGVESPGADGLPVDVLTLTDGALATSGDARRFLLRDGVRYGHILDPRTGWPVPHAPRSVTVASGTCTHAGLLATLAMLAGDGAESFLREEGVRHWVQRDTTA